VPLFVRDAEDVPKGNRELLRRGAAAFPSGPQPVTLRESLEAASKKKSTLMETADLFAASAFREAPIEYHGSRSEKALTSTRRKKK
jgi:hypothetical protein